MAVLVDTTVRLLSQEPLAARVPASGILEVAEVLDKAGFAALEVSGGGCFDAAVRRGVESPWERIRALSGRCSTPLQMALRGRFLVGSRPLEGDLVRRFVECAAGNGIDIFRLHDPLNDLENLKEAADAIRGEREGARDRARVQPRARRRRRRPGRARESPVGARRGARADPRPGRLAVPGTRSRAGRASRRGERPAGRPARAGRGRHRARGGDRGRAGRGGPHRLRRLPGRDLAPPRLRPRRSRSTSRRSTSTPASSSTSSGRRRSSWTTRSARIRFPRCPRGSPSAPRSTAFRPASSPSSTTTLRRQGFGDRLDAVLDELQRVRAETGWPPLAAPIGQMLGSQALVHVLSAQRWQLFVDELPDLIEGRYGELPGEVDPAVKRAADLLGATGAPEEDALRSWTRSARRSRGSPRARRSCSWSRSSARRPSRCSTRSAPAAAATTATARASSAPSRSGCAT